MTNGRTAASGPPAHDATAAWHPGCASITAADPTPHSATGHPSAAFTKTVSRTARPAPTRGRSELGSHADGRRRLEANELLAQAAPTLVLECVNRELGAANAPCDLVRLHAEHEAHHQYLPLLFGQLAERLANRLEPLG